MSFELLEWGQIPEIEKMGSWLYIMIPFLAISIYVLFFEENSKENFILKILSIIVILVSCFYISKKHEDLLGVFGDSYYIKAKNGEFSILVCLNENDYNKLKEKITIEHPSLKKEDVEKVLGNIRESFKRDELCKGDKFKKK